MPNLALRIYQVAPMPFRSAMAGARGMYLRAWRYGSETDRYLEEARTRERWTSEQWSAYQGEQLSRLLARAAARVPYYRAQWEARRRAGDRRSVERLEHWPILSKETVRANPRAFVADDRDVRRMYRERTSGTTGTPLELWLSRETVRTWFALYELRAREWNGVTWRDHWAMMGGQAVVPANRTRPPFWVWNAPMHQLYISANHESRDNALYIIDAMRKRRVTHLVTYASTGAALASDALLGGYRLEGLRALITNAEPVFPWQREAIQQAFGCPVRETYGMAELVAAASECSHQSLHLWPDVGHLEVLRDDEDCTVSPGNAGRFVCTGLLNPDMPLVRFAVGDRGALARDQSCACGRTLPLLDRVEGRTNDLLIARDGRRVYWVNPIFYGLPIRQAQIVQETLDRVRIRYAPAAGITFSAESEMASRLRARLGQVSVVFDQVERIPQEANGKFKSVRCDLSADERQLAEAGVRREL